MVCISYHIKSKNLKFNVIHHINSLNKKNITISMDAEKDI